MTNTERMRIWRENNRERYREITNKATAKWRKSNPDKVKAKAKRDNDHYNFGGRRTAVLDRDSYRCCHCGTSQDLTVDHINRDRKDNNLSNLQTLCRPCHGRKDGQARKIKSGWKWHD